MKFLWNILFFLAILVSIYMSPILLASDDFENDFSDSSTDGASKNGFEFTGFLELEQGIDVDKGGPSRKHNDNNDWVMANRRLRLQTSKVNDNGGLYIKLDTVRDDISEKTNIELREARISYTLLKNVDLNIGKQVNTWGVGDLIFINDLFPKNWIANFNGSDTEQMKLSGSSIRISSYFSNSSFDIVYHPKFTPDKTPTGYYFSVYNPNSNSIVKYSNEDSSYKSESRENSGEVSSMLKFNFSGHELAFYGYHGFYKSPKGLKIDDGQLVSYHPRLNVYGLSYEGQVGPGILTFESGLYNSIEDSDGKNRLIENSLVKGLVGYRLDFSESLSFGLQWYQEYMLNYDEYKLSISSARYRKKKAQNTYTARLTLKLMQETLFFNVFCYLRPEDRDSFVKMEVSKKVDNNLLLIFGSNIFTGNRNYKSREFGMLKGDSNIFGRIRYSLF